MSALNGFKLVAAKRPQQATPVVARRHKLSKQIYEQQQLATAMAEGGTYAPVRLRSVKDKHTGERKNIESAKRIKPWWFTAENGRVCLQVRYGTRVLDLAKGKNSIEVTATTSLPTKPVAPSADAQQKAGTQLKLSARRKGVVRV